MIDYKLLERAVINDIKPMIVTKFLIMNELLYYIIPKEVIWFIMELQYNTDIHVMNMYKDINLIICNSILFIHMYSIAYNKSIKLVDYGLDPDINKLLYEDAIKIYNNHNIFKQDFNIDYILGIYACPKLYQCMMAQNKMHQKNELLIGDMRELTKLTINKLISDKKYLSKYKIYKYRRRKPFTYNSRYQYYKNFIYFTRP
jgi:hypothetical protein